MANKRINKVIVLPGQNIYGIAIREYGSYEGVFLLLEDNNWLDAGLDTILTPGQQLIIKQPPIKPDIVAYYKANNIYPVTEVENAEDILNATGDYDSRDYDSRDFFTN